ncbi:MAG: hypothetical protein AAF388_02050 [Bacteroidota bacterium]
MSTSRYIIINWHWGSRVKNILRIRKAGKKPHNAEIIRTLQVKDEEGNLQDTLIVIRPNTQQVSRESEEQELRTLQVKDREGKPQDAMTIIPVDIRIGPRESTRQTKKEIITHILVSLFGDEVEVQKGELQFFFHRGDWMDELQDFWSLGLDKGKDLSIRYHAFGGGVGYVYDLEGGLLDSGVSNFKVKEGDFTAAAEFEKGNPIYIYEDNFVKTWNYYWLLTLNKLRGLQQELMLACIPEAPDSAMEAAQSRVENFLSMYAKLHENDKMYSRYKNNKIKQDEWDFSTCVDLLERIEKINEAKDKELGLKEWTIALETFVLERNKTDKVIFGKIFRGFQYLFKTYL